MPKENFNDLQAFLVVARNLSFTKAAAQLGVSASALSHSMRGLEGRLGLRLLTRTTRSVSPTEAGERLLRSIGPHFEQIEQGLAALNELRQKPAGTIRVTAGDHAAVTILWPKLSKLLAQYPDIKIEINMEGGLIDIAAQRFDAGVRLGEQVSKDMVSVRIGPDLRFAVVGTKAYFARHGVPKTPRDLVGHSCINLRMPTYGGIWPWEFERNRREMKVRVDGQIVLNNVFQVRDAVLEGLGLAYIPEDLAKPYISKGQLVWVLEEWSPPWSGYHLYYPSRRQSSPAFALVVEALRYAQSRA
jgi:DNA-binding transcriptional LysR family regulator